MTKDAQFALRRGIGFYNLNAFVGHKQRHWSATAVIEKYTRNTRFCLICNYVSKIIPALQSRCTRFRFPPLDVGYVQDRLQHVVHQEG